MMALPPAPLELQELREDRADAREVAVDVLVGENFAALVLAGRVADPGGAAAHQRDRPVAGLLHPVEHHDRQQRADMQRGRRAVEPDIGRDRSRAGPRVERLRLGDLVDEAPIGQYLQEIGFVGAHAHPFSASRRVPSTSLAGQFARNRRREALAQVGIARPLQIALEQHDGGPAVVELDRVAAAAFLRRARVRCASRRCRSACAAWTCRDYRTTSAGAHRARRATLRRARCSSGRTPGRISHSRWRRRASRHSVRAPPAPGRSSRSPARAGASAVSRHRPS